MNAIINLETSEYQIPDVLDVLDELPEILPSNLIERGVFVRRHNHAELCERIRARRQAAVDAAQRWADSVEVTLVDFDPAEPCDQQAFDYAAGNTRTLLAEAARLDQLLTPRTGQR